MKKLQILFLILLMILTGCQHRVQEVSFGQSVDEAVRELKIVTTSDNIGEVQLGFLPPSEMSEAQDDFVGWLILYDSKPFDHVWASLSTMTLLEIEKLADIEGANQGYLVDKFEWADGLGNTLNKDQSTFCDGAAFETGLYHFYVATISEDGAIGMSESDMGIDIKAKAKNIELIKTEKGYKLSFESQADERLKYHFLMVSEESLYTLKEELSSLTYKDFKDLAKAGQGILKDADETIFEFDTTLLTYEGGPIERSLYNVYVVSLSKEKMLDVARGKHMIVTEKNVSKPDRIINEGLGTVMLVGGGVSSSNLKDLSVFESLRKAAGDGVPKLAIISSSRNDSEAVYNHFYFKDPEFGSFEDNYEKLGFEPIFIPLAVDNAADIRNNPYWASLLASCSGAYLQGGDQFKHAKSLLNDDGTPSLMLQALESILDRGGVVAGTSAGMAVMGEWAYGYGYSLEALTFNQLEKYPVASIPEIGDLVSELNDNIIACRGIGLLSQEALLDTHFDKRGRLGRLLVAMRDTEKTIGIGVDEGACLSIQNQIATVYGHQGVFILDGTDAQYGSSGDLTNFSVENMRLHYLTEGDRYDFWTQNVIKNPVKKPIEENGFFKQENPIFGEDYATTKLLIDFIHSEDVSIEVPYKLINDQVLMISFTKDHETSSYTSNEKYEDSILSPYSKSSIEGLKVAVFLNQEKDVNPPTIDYMKSYTKPYKVYLGVSDDLSGIDERTVNQNTIQFTSHNNTLYKEPFYDVDYKEIGIVISEDFFTEGDQVHVKGLKDLEGNLIEEQTWLYNGNAWEKISN